MAGPQEGFVESWVTDDGRRWQKIDATSSGQVWPTEFGWLMVGYLDSDVAVSPDGRTWQEVRFDFPELEGTGGSGTWAVGRSMFLARQDDVATGPTHSMWVGRVADG